MSLYWYKDKEPQRERWIGQGIAAWILRTTLDDIEVEETSPGFVHCGMTAISKSTGNVFSYIHNANNGKVYWWHGIEEGGDRSFTPKDRSNYDMWCLKNNVRNDY